PRAPRAPPSFPTRRSSDLQARGWLTAIDASTGAVKWRYESGRPMLAGVTATSADVLFTGELDGHFLVLDARDGTVLFRHPVGGRSEEHTSELQSRFDLVCR